MLNILVNQTLDKVLKPIVRRMGSTLAGGVATMAVLQPEQIEQLDASITALGLIAIDLLLSYANKRGFI